MGGLSAGEGQSGSAGGGRCDSRAVRRGSEGQSVPDLESAVVGVLLSAAGEGRGDTETPWQWDENPWHTDDCGQGRPDGGGPQAGGEGRTDLPSRFLRVPAATVGSGRGRGMSGAVLEDRLGHRSGYSEVLRQCRSRSRGQGGGGPRRCSVGGAVCEAVAVCAVGAARWDLAAA